MSLALFSEGLSRNSWYSSVKFHFEITCSEDHCPNSIEVLLIRISGSISFSGDDRYRCLRGRFQNLCRLKSIRSSSMFLLFYSPLPPAAMSWIRRILSSSDAYLWTPIFIENLEVYVHDMVIICSQSLHNEVYTATGTYPRISVSAFQDVKRRTCVPTATKTPLLIAFQLLRRHTSKRCSSISSMLAVSLHSFDQVMFHTLFCPVSIKLKTRDIVLFVNACAGSDWSYSVCSEYAGLILT